MDVVGEYEIKPFTRYRQYVVDVLEEGSRRHHVYDWIGIDVTRARQYLRGYKRKTGETLSHTGWIIKCVSQAVSEHKEVQAYRHGNGKLVIFDDVDVWLALEVTVEDEKRIWPIILRKTNEKSVKEIHDEIRKAQAEQSENGDAEIDDSTAKLRKKLNRPWPKFVRKLFWRRLRKDAFFAKNIMGTIAVTAPVIGMKSSQWSIPIGLHPIIIAVGAIAKKPAVIDNKIEVREYLDLTILSDHDVCDGAPVSRFITRLAELMENAFGLVDH